MEITVEILKNFVSALEANSKEVSKSTLLKSDTLIAAQENERSLLEKRLRDIRSISQLGKIRLVDEVKSCYGAISFTPTFVLELAKGCLDNLEEDEVNGQEIWDLEERVKELEKSESNLEDKVEELKDQKADLEDEISKLQREVAKISDIEDALAQLQQAASAYMDDTNEETFSRLWALC